MKVAGIMYGVVIVIVVGLLIAMIGWTDSNLDWIVSKIANSPKDVPYWLSAVATFIFNGFALAFNIIVYIIRLIVG